MKFENNGEFNRSIILSSLEDFCEVEEIQFSEDLIYSKEFIDFIIWCCDQLATNRSGAGKFVKINKEIFQTGKYTRHTADHLFKTFCYILREIDRKRRRRKKWRYM